jgi:three-Cys-motif partner protein
MGVGVNRMLTRSGDIPDSWQHRLDELFGTHDWYNAFYKPDGQTTLFELPERKIKARIDDFSRFFLSRLKGTFASVAENPAVLRNSKNSPLYLLCFAAGNPTGAPLAVKIAQHILKMGS